MKTLTILEPWATLICEGKKTVETRNWDTPYRGKILIHASRRGMPEETYEKYLIKNFTEHEIHRGCIVGEAELVDIVPFEEEFQRIIEDNRIVDYATVEIGSTYAWILKNPMLYEHPIPARGGLGLWEY